MKPVNPYPLYLDCNKATCMLVHSAWKEGDKHGFEACVSYLNEWCPGHNITGTVSGNLDKKRYQCPVCMEKLLENQNR